jgi:hypothetical protein
MTAAAWVPVFTSGQRPGICALCGNALELHHPTLFLHNPRPFYCPLRLTISRPPMPEQSPTIPPIQQSVAALAATAATNPPDHHSHSIFSRLMDWLLKNPLPAVESQVASALTQDAGTHTP